MLIFEAIRKKNNNKIIYFDGSEETIRFLEREYDFIYRTYDLKTKKKENKITILIAADVFTISPGTFLCISDFSIQVIGKGQLKMEFELTDKQLEAIDNASIKAEVQEKTENF